MSIRTTILPFLLCLLATASHAQTGVWKALPNFTPLGSIYAVCAVNDDTVFVGTTDGQNWPHIQRTTDGGLTWVDQTPNMDPVPNESVGMSFIKYYGDTLFALLGNYFYKSGDMGDHWYFFGSVLPGAMEWMDYNPISRIGYGRGDGGNFKYTTDGWNTLTYRSVNISAGGGKPAMIGLGDTVLFGSGQDYTKPLMPQIIVSYNGGQSFFSPTGLPLGGGVGDVKCKGTTCYCTTVISNVDDTIATIGFYKSTDAGASWVDLTPNLPFPRADFGGFFDAFDVYSSQEVILAPFVNINGVGFRSRILRSTDGGASWQVDSVAWNDSTLDGTGLFEYSSPTTAYGALGRGAIVKYELQQSTGITGSSGNSSSVIVSPNPTGANFIVDLIGAVGGSFELTNTLGQVVISQPVNTGSNIIFRGSLPAGIYTYTVRNGATLLGSGKLLLL